MSGRAGTLAAETAAALERYYHWHAPIYDLTRWSFLFGRAALLRRIAAEPAPRHVLEVGCGTGRNLAMLARRFPDIRLTGVDLSRAMLARAEQRVRGFGRRVHCLRQRFDAPLPLDPPVDMLLFSYALTMMNPGWEQALRAAAEQLAARGRLAVVDFAGTPWPWFRRWMARNHVRLDDHLLPILQTSFAPEVAEVRHAYGGAWQYFLFIGRAGAHEVHEPGGARLLPSRGLVERTVARREPRPTEPRFMESALFLADLPSGHEPPGSAGFSRQHVESGTVSPDESGVPRRRFMESPLDP